MDSPHSGFHRAATASWTLAGLGVAGIAGASALAYADTFKPPATEAPVVAAAPDPQELVPAPALDVPEAPNAVPTIDDPSPAAPPPKYTPDPAVEPAPATHEMPTPQYTPKPAYTVQQTAEPAPASGTAQATAPSAPPTTKRRNLTPTTVMAPNFSPHVTRSHGS